MNIKHKFVLPLLLILTLAGFSLAPVPSASALPACSTDSNAAICKTDNNLIGGILKNVINVMLYLAGTIAVIMIVVGGLRYITSDGDPAKATQARQTVIYALVGVGVAVLSFSVVNFVIAQL